jgi:hypothetical protein
VKYTASSVKKALNANSNLKIEDHLGCPLEKIRNFGNNERRLSNCNAVCYGNHKNCKYVPLKCKQLVCVIAKEGLYLLPFRFTISKDSPEGCIEKHDTALATIIKRGLIDPKLLKAV